ncbi:MAG TPA: hypothetical protein VF559_12535 [Caulobacteraceae bacterium]
MEVQDTEPGRMPAGAVKAYIVDMVEELAKLALNCGDAPLAQRLRELPIDVPRRSEAS